MIRLPVSRATHERELAAKDSRIGFLERRTEQLKDALRTTADAASYYSRQNEEARARLAKFDPNRRRDERGRYMKDA